jgi:hypothetical protein
VYAAFIAFPVSADSSENGLYTASEVLNTALFPKFENNNRFLTFD